MKNIRIDYYRYRIKKGRADILLQINGGDSYCIPFRYVEADEQIARIIKNSDIEDDSNGDLVINDYTLNDCHLTKEDKDWVQLNKVMELSLPRNEFNRKYKHIFSFFMDLCPVEEQGIRSNVLDLVDVLEVDTLKKQYVSELKHALEKKRWVILDATMTPPDPELIKKEIETLEHFRVLRPNEETVIERDGILMMELASDRYSYVPIDWETFGAEIKPVSMFRRLSHMAPYSNICDDTSEEEGMKEKD